MARRSSSPPPGAAPPSNDGPTAERSRANEAGAAGRLSDSTSLRVEDARRLRDELDQLLDRYDVEGPTRATTDGMTAGCALCVDPAPVLHGLRQALDTALNQAADRSEVGDHE